MTGWLVVKRQSFEIGIKVTNWVKDTLRGSLTLRENQLVSIRC